MAAVESQTAVTQIWAVFIGKFYSLYMFFQSPEFMPSSNKTKKEYHEAKHAVTA